MWKYALSALRTRAERGKGRRMAGGCHIYIYMHQDAAGCVYTCTRMPCHVNVSGCLHVSLHVFPISNLSSRRPELYNKRKRLRKLSLHKTPKTRIVPAESWPNVQMRQGSRWKTSSDCCRQFNAHQTVQINTRHTVSESREPAKQTKYLRPARWPSGKAQTAGGQRCSACAPAACSAVGMAATM